MNATDEHTTDDTDAPNPNLVAAFRARSTAYLPVEVVRGAVLSIAMNSKVVGFCARYPDGHVTMWEWEKLHGSVTRLDQLLRNGLLWTVLVPVSPSGSWIWGAIRYVALQNGCPFVTCEQSDDSYATLQEAGLWRRGLTAANDAGRLLRQDEANPPDTDEEAGQ